MHDFEFWEKTAAKIIGETHESGITSSLTSRFQTVTWRSNVTYGTAPQARIRGEHIVHGVPTGVPEPKCIFDPHAPKGPQVLEVSPSSEESAIFFGLCIHPIPGVLGARTIFLWTLHTLKGRTENLG